LQTDEGDATALRPFGVDTLVNMSVWTDVATLRAFVYRSGHAAIMSRRREWFEELQEAWLVLWWVPAGHHPTIAEARERLDRLRSAGPTPAAFDLRTAFAAPDSSTMESDDSFPGKPSERRIP
jgi:hypothetical protein